jgi:hypothetical protein
VVLIEPEQTILLAGDSITDCGRRDRAAPYGDGYVRLVRNLLLAHRPARRQVTHGVAADAAVRHAHP